MRSCELGPLVGFDDPVTDVGVSATLTVRGTLPEYTTEDWL